MKKVAILGSTGSIGTQALDVIESNKDRFKVTALTCGSNVRLLSEQIRKFRPALAVCMNKGDAVALSGEFPGVQILWGGDGLIAAAESDCDILLNSLMGMRGLVPTYHGIMAGHDIALANKETLVAGGSVIMEAVKNKGVRMLPVDSEHSAIFQCLEGNRDKKIKKILLTASGGPFRGWSLDRLKTVTPEMALKHPNWSMGRKITIDSATMMNKGLEMIEAKWLFGVDIDDIQVLVHPQSIMHSAVEFCDTSILAQLGVPDMRIPISVALGYPDRLGSHGSELDFFKEAAMLTFEKPDMRVFKCMKLAVDAARAGGSYPVVMNAANEVLVEAFLNGRTGFTDIGDSIERIMDEHESVSDPSLEDIIEIDRKTREKVEREI